MMSSIVRGRMAFLGKSDVQLSAPLGNISAHGVKKMNVPSSTSGIGPIRSRPPLRLLNWTAAPAERGVLLLREAESARCKPNRPPGRPQSAPPSKTRDIGTTRPLAADPRARVRAIEQG